MLPETTNALDLNTKPGIKIRRSEKSYLTTWQTQIFGGNSIWYHKIVKKLYYWIDVSGFDLKYAPAVMHVLSDGTSHSDARVVNR